MAGCAWCTRERQNRPTTLCKYVYLIDKSHRYFLLRPHAREICFYPTRSEAFLARVRLDARIFVFPDIVLKPHFFTGCLATTIFLVA